jgi:hypothetical protein
MAYERNPDDPNRSDDEFRRAARLDTELQPDTELAEGPASTGKIAMFAIAIAVVLGVVFFGLNNSTINRAGTSSTAQNTTQSSPPGTTTGAAPARPQMPPATAPTEMKRPVNPPADNAPSK